MGSSFFHKSNGDGKCPELYHGEGSTLMHRDERPLLADVTCRVEFIEDFWSFTAMWHDRRVGYAWCNAHGDALEFADLKVTNQLVIPWMPLFPQYLAAKRDFRRKGIGSALIRLVLKTASEQKMTRIYGWGTQSDLEQFPGILEWFQEFGFKTSLSNGIPLTHAAWAIKLATGS